MLLLKKNYQSFQLDVKMVVTTDFPIVPKFPKMTLRRLIYA